MHNFRHTYSEQKLSEIAQNSAAQVAAINAQTRQLQNSTSAGVAAVNNLSSQLAFSLASLGLSIWLINRNVSEIRDGLQKSNNLLEELVSYERKKQTAVKCPFCKSPLLEPVRICPACREKLNCVPVHFDGLSTFIAIGLTEEQKVIQEFEQLQQEALKDASLMKQAEQNWQEYLRNIEPSAETRRLASMQFDHYSLGSAGLLAVTFIGLPAAVLSSGFLMRFAFDPAASSLVKSLFLCSIVVVLAFNGLIYQAVRLYYRSKVPAAVQLAYRAMSEYETARQTGQQALEAVQQKIRELEVAYRFIGEVLRSCRTFQFRR